MDIIRLESLYKSIINVDYGISGIKGVSFARLSDVPLIADDEMIAEIWNATSGTKSRLFSNYEIIFARIFIMQSVGGMQ